MVRLPVDVARALRRRAATADTTIAQATPPDMRGPIAIGLGWPERVPDAAPAFDWSKASSWEFFPLDNDAFPSVGLARHVGELAGTAPAVFNAANEECVDAFLKGALPFNGIMDTVTKVVQEHGSPRTGSAGTSLTVADVLEAETWARARARELTKTQTTTHTTTQTTAQTMAPQTAQTTTAEAGA